MRYGQSIEWTDAAVAELRRLFDEGLSARQIAARMGGQRNAVIGKLFRLGLRRREKALKEAPPRTPRKPRGLRVRSTHFRPPVQQLRPAPILAPSSAHCCDLLALTNSSCRWPVTDESPHMFCGDPTADFPSRPYCPFHARIGRGRANTGREQPQVTYRDRRRFVPRTTAGTETPDLSEVQPA